MDKISLMYSTISLFLGVFEGATKVAPPCGIGASPQSGAMYATDLMLAWDKDKDGNKVTKHSILYGQIIFVYVESYANAWWQII